MNFFQEYYELMISKQEIDVEQGSRTLVCKFVQKPLLRIPGACLNLFSNFVMVILMCCIIIMQIMY